VENNHGLRAEREDLLEKDTMLKQSMSDGAQAWQIPSTKLDVTWVKNAVEG